MNLNELLAEINNADLRVPDPTPLKKSKATPTRYFRAKYRGSCAKCGARFDIGDLVVFVKSKLGEGVCHYWHWVYTPVSERTGRTIAKPAPWRKREPYTHEEEA